VGIVTVSTDKPGEIARNRAKHGVAATMLSDTDLKVTSLYNIRNEKNIYPGGLGPLPIPTTFLVDAGGVVRWIDQSEDYQLRSQPERVLAAIEQL